MSDRDERAGRSKPQRDEISRRNLLRKAGLVGVGALGAGFAAGCKNRPEEDFVDLSTDPTLLQQGGTVSGQLRGLLEGQPASDVLVRLLRFGTTRADERGRFELRVDQPGEYRVEFNGTGFHRRSGRIQVNGSVALDVRLFEDDAGLPLPFLNEYARGTGPNKEGVVPRTPGATNRWTRPPVVVIFRQLADDDKDVIPDARLTAMQASIRTLFAPLTGNVLGPAPAIEVRDGQPPRRLENIRAGSLVIAQRKDRRVASEHGGSTTNPFEIVQARIASGVESDIELFNRMFAHGLGGWVVSAAADSILNPEGRAQPSSRDLQAATFLYNRPPGSTSPDRDPAGVLLGG